MPKFAKLNLTNWRQFSDVEIDLHERLTVLTGANGAGKSTIIRIFSQHLGFQRPLLSTPYIGLGGAISYFSGQFSRSGNKILHRVSKRNQAEQRPIGSIVYDNGVIAALTAPDITSASFNIGITNQQQVLGTHIDSHQPISNYKVIDKIPLKPMAARDAYTHYNNEVNRAYSGSRNPQNETPMYKLKESLISLAVFGEGNVYVEGNEELLKFYRGFEEILGNLLPEDIGFEGLRIQPPEVLLKTRSGEFMIDAVSGGILTLIDFAWRIFTFSKMHDDFVVTIDEPENHLHPTIQRELLPRLLRAFPRAQFIVATHSPFMVTSVKESNVFALRYEKFEVEQETDFGASISEGRRVRSLGLSSIKRAATANEILREVLGVSATMPIWAHSELRQIMAEFEGRAVSNESVAALRAELEGRGFEELYPEALAKFVSSKND